MNRPADRRTTGVEPEPLAQAVLSDLQVDIVHADGDLRVIAHTPGLDVDGHEASEGLIDQALADLFPELIGSEEDLEAVARGEIPRFELPMINRMGPDGADQRYLSLTALRHPEIQGRLVLLVQDVTAEGRLDQKLMQQLNEVRLLRARLEAANKELVRLDEEKSAFLRMAAHDLRAPLTVIKGYVDMVVEDTESQLDEDAIDFLGVVMNRTDQMAHLIDNLLDVEKIESGEVTLRLQPLDLGAQVEQIAKGFRPVAEQKGVTLHWKATPDLPRPLADENRLVQALNNLVSNALKFTPTGGLVVIEVLERDADLVVEVIDTGPGISEEDQARLFQRFFRTDEARQQHIPGTGLGLSIVKAIIEQHGGNVYCHSHVGKGSTFGFDLPLQQT